MADVIACAGCDLDFSSDDERLVHEAECDRYLNEVLLDPEWIALHPLWAIDEYGVAHRPVQRLHRWCDGVNWWEWAWTIACDLVPIPMPKLIYVGDLVKPDRICSKCGDGHGPEIQRVLGHTEVHTVV